MALLEMPGLGVLVVLEDVDGARHMFLPRDIGLWSDVDGHHTETHLVVKGRTLRFNVPLDDIVNEVTKAQGKAIGF